MQFMLGLDRHVYWTSMAVYIYIFAVLVGPTHASIDLIFKQVESEYHSQQKNSKTEFQHLRSEKNSWTESQNLRPETDVPCHYTSFIIPDKMPVNLFVNFLDLMFKQVESENHPQQKNSWTESQNLRPEKNSKTEFQHLRSAWNAYKLPNRNETFVKFQYDMIMSKEHFERVMAKEPRTKRGAVHPNFLWPRTIPYEIDDGFENKWQRNILMAIQHVMQHTCVTFKPHEDEKNYILFVPTLSECSSYVGVLGNEQLIKLQVPHCMKTKAIVHEIGHALGLYHEHMRSDRDDYVHVYKDNIIEGKEYEFSKMNKGEYANYGCSYDLKSVMHYGKHYFAKSDGNKPLVTMEPIDETFADGMGHADGLSYGDIKMLNAMYQCSAGCKKKHCQADQFLGKNCECICSGSSGKGAKPCIESVGCKLPSTLDSLDHCFWNKQTDQPIYNIDEVVDHGTSVEITYCNTSSCGKVESTMKCKDGIWEGNAVLPCINVMCVTDPAWNEDYIISQESGEMNFSIDNIIPHGEIIYMNCKHGANIINILTCAHEQWDGVMLPCTGEDCTVSYRSCDDRVVYVLDGRELQDGEPVNHTTVVEAVCKYGDGYADDSTDVKCLNGSWIGATPYNCPPDICVPDYRKKFESRVVITPALWLHRMICVPSSGQQIDVAVLVKIESVRNDGGMTEAVGRVKKVIYAGYSHLQPGKSKMVFRYWSFCKQPNLQENKSYYILAKEGFQIGNTMYMTEHFNTSIMVKRNTRTRIIMHYFNRLIEYGCRN